MILAENLVRRFGDTVAVNSVGFSIEKGEIVGLLGHNGAGKSTVMKLLTGFLEPDFGSISVAGKYIAENPLITKQIIGYLPENLPLYPDMTVLDYLKFTAAVRGIEKRARAETIRSAIQACALEDRVIQPINTLSRGYRQRVGVAQAILHKPDILILDEPTNGLDPDQTLAMRNLIRELAGRATVILSTHIMQEVDAVCDRVLILRDGKLALDDNMTNLKSSQRLHLSTSASRQKIQSVLGNLVRITRGADQQSFWLEFGGGLTSELSAEANRKLVGSDIPVWALHPEKRDLEQVFRQISSGGSING